jgi:dTMP kinase
MARLIVFEGIDGSGKTSLSKCFLARLQSEGVPAVWLYEPTDSPPGRRIRRLAQDRDSISVQEELELFIADRRWDVERNVLPALRAGTTVVMDRYYYSNACYQGARGLDMDEILRRNREFAPDPDLVFIVDVDVDRALERIALARAARAKLFEKKEFLEKVRGNYLALRGPNLALIDGNPPLAEVIGPVLARYALLAGSAPRDWSRGR